jgi:cytochrome b subunit of formate dehydrogenase
MKAQQTFLRFPLAYRIEHWLIVLSFTTLAVTGLVQKFAFAAVSIWLINLMGGIEQVRIIHRIAAIILILEALYHVGIVGYNLIVRRYNLDLLPTWQDLKNAVHALQFNLRLRNDRPLQGRYTFEEKFEYFGIIWGTLVMALTGFVLWNPIASTAVLPGEFVPAAKVLHSGEALLAVLAILVWHMYHVHIRKFNKSMFTGRLSAEEMAEEHPLEIAAHEQADEAAPDPQRPRRHKLYITAYGLFAVAMLVLTYIFVTFEQTAIETVEPLETVNAYSPVEAQQRPVLAAFDAPMTSWEDGIGQFLETRCAFCHGGTVPLSQLNLTTYDQTLLGGTSMPAVVPNDPDNSGIIIELRDQEHAVAVADEDLAKLTAWIAAGAPR